MAYEKHFWHRLESLRGIFALTVAVYHSFLMVRSHEFAGKIVRGLLNVFYGQGAVISFFILSGLVLGQSLRRSRGGYLIFYARRFLRIYPALVASLILSGFLLGVFHFWKSYNPAATHYYESIYTFDLSLRLFFKNLFLLDFSLNGVTWTLWIEIIGSLFLPILHVASRKMTSRLLLMSCLIILQIIPTKNFLNGGLPYLWIFYLGYLIPLFSNNWWEYLSKERGVLIFLLLVSLIVCWFTPHFGNHQIPYTLGSCFFISSVYHLPKEHFFSFLDNNLVKFYGRISYSFYLMHFLILYSVSGWVFQMLSPDYLIDHSIAISLCLAIISTGIVTPISFVCYSYIEKPFVRLGQRLAELSK